METVQDDHLFSIHQDKLDYNSATYTLKDLLNEQIKNCESFTFNTTKQLFDKLAGYRHIMTSQQHNHFTKQFHMTIALLFCVTILNSTLVLYFLLVLHLP